MMLAETAWQSTLDYFQHLIATRNLTFFLLTGLAILAVAFLVLTRTRWGQAKPVSKCIALSILAHVLLGGYAWGTKLMFSVPTIAPAERFQVTLTSDTPPPTKSHSKPEAKKLAPWKKFDNAKSFEGSIQPIEKQELGKPFQVEKTDSFRQKLEVVEPKVEKQPGPVAESKTVPNSSNVSHRIEKPKTAPETLSVERRGESAPKGNLLQANTEQPERLQAVDSNIVRNPKNESGSTVTGALRPKVSDLVENVHRSAKSSDNQFNPVNQRLKEVRNDIGHSVPLENLANSRAKRFDGQIMPEIYRLRTSKNRLEAVKKLGGSAKTEAAVKAALKWLAANQQKDGRWNPRQTGGGQERLVLGHHRQGAGTNADTGISGLAILAFLGAGHTQHEGPYRDNIKRGLDFLIASQKANGSLEGGAKLYARTYCHSMALLALSEAFAITGDDDLKSAVEKGVDFGLRSQSRVDGGWRYQPGDPGDMSQFGWQVMALKAAKVGGVDVPEQAFKNMRHFLGRCSFGTHKGLAAYRPVERVSTTMTAEALVCRHFLYGEVDEKTANEASSYVLKTPPSKDKVNYYYWYYGTLAMFQTGGESWQKWNNQIAPILVGSQIRSGENQGAWPANGMWAGYGGSVYSTAMATLSLEVYYRYLTTIR